MDRLKQKLILVGNKPSYKSGLDKIIDSFDYVLRIGRMNLLGETGKKINGIYLEANKVFKYVFKGGENRSEIKRASNIFMHKHWYEQFKEWELFLTKEQYQNVEVIDYESSVRAIGHERPTSAVLMLAYLLNSSWKDEFDIYITCLDIENRAKLIDNNPFWNYHKGAGKIEESYLKKLIQNEVIKRIEDE